MASFATDSNHRVLFIDQGEFKSVEMLSGWEAVRYDEHPFRAKIKVSAWTVFELSLFEQKSQQERKKEDEKWHFCYRTLEFSCLPHGF